ncbi:unnamed protein product [Discosporangium mesarthrocarpum]
MEVESFSTPSQEVSTTIYSTREGVGVDAAGRSEFDAYLDNPPSCAGWQDRQECPTCGFLRRYYCFQCFSIVGMPDTMEALNLILPLKVDIIITGKERKKSSGVQVGVMAPNSVQLVPFEGDIPDYDPATTFVVFPSHESVCWDELKPEDLQSAKGLILVDSRWERTGPILNHPKLSGLRHIRIRHPPKQSRFWRWHLRGEGHICTAEATYFVLKEFEQASGLTTSGGRLEDILFMFAMMHDRIRVALKTDPTRAGKQEPMGETAKKEYRQRSVKTVDRLLKPKHVAIKDIRDLRGEEVALEAYFLQRSESGR